MNSAPALFIMLWVGKQKALFFPGSELGGGDDMEFVTAGDLSSQTLQTWCCSAEDTGSVC